MGLLAEWDGNNEFNVGLSKRHPGLSLISAVDGKEIPVCYLLEDTYISNIEEGHALNSWLIGPWF
jgi:hypothetical protein